MQASSINRIDRASASASTGLESAHRSICAVVVLMITAVTAFPDSHDGEMSDSGIFLAAGGGGALYTPTGSESYQVVLRLRRSSRCRLPIRRFPCRQRKARSRRSRSNRVLLATPRSNPGCRSSASWRRLGTIFQSGPRSSRTSAVDSAW